jgi:hypothetical protein
MRWQQYEENLAFVKVFCTMLFTEQETPTRSLMDITDYLGWQLSASSAHQLNIMQQNLLQHKISSMLVSLNFPICSKKQYTKSDTIKFL